MRNTQYFKVTAFHTSEDWSCREAICTVKEDTSIPSVNGSSVSYIANMFKYGCSKNYHTPVDAITCMLMDHGCSNIRMWEVSREEGKKGIRLENQQWQIRRLMDQNKWSDIAVLAKQFAEEKEI